MINTKIKVPLRANSHVLRLLGEELIGDDGLAVFELVKNGYDADAKQVIVNITFKDKVPSIFVADDGCGMSLEDIQSKWLVLATDSKRGELRRIRSPIFNRLPLGEKGVGRVAAFKLGGKLSMVTRKKNCNECELTIDLDELIAQGSFLDELSVDIQSKEQPRVFFGNQTGTEIEIKSLYRQNWERGDLRKLNRLITSLASPFKTNDDFSVELCVPGRERDLEGMFSPEDFKEQAVWQFTFDISETGFSWDYKFRPPLWNAVVGRNVSSNQEKLLLQEIEHDTNQEARAVFQKEQLTGIGPIRGAIFGYHQSPEVLKATGNKTQLKKWLSDQTGIRVYRDNVRVFNYGEPTDDWLGLNIRRINRPGERFGTNSLVAAISLDLEKSFLLKEKTNREGFDSGGAFPTFHQLVSSAFERFEREAIEDRKKLDDVIRGKGTSTAPLRFLDAINTLKQGVKNQRIPEAFQLEIDAIEKEFIELRDITVRAGTAGLNLAVIFHEIEREVDALASAVERKLDEDTLKKQIEQIHYMLHGFAPLLRGTSAKNIFCSKLIEMASRVRVSRFAFHGITFSAPVLTNEEPDFKILVAPNLLVGAIGNLLDNAMYWTKVRQETSDAKIDRAIRIATQYREDDESWLIAVIDNGPGFTENALAKATTAFFSERPSGMGLGLYFARMVTEQMGGVLTLSTTDELRDEMTIPKAFDGAAVVMRFKGRQ
jgi:hypothetical protein